jgi:hypothetical protein
MGIEFEPIKTHLTYDQAMALLHAHVQDPGILAHCRETEVIMRALARRFGQDEEEWAVIGLLHDVDFQETRATPAQHCVKAKGMLRDGGMSELAIDVIFSHAYGTECGGPEARDRQRTRPMEHALVAAETLTGLIFAAALMTPEKKLEGLTVNSLKKKYKSKGFARNCNREFMAEIERTGLSMDEFFEIGIRAMQGIAPEIGL